MHVNDLAHGVPIGEVNEVEEAPAQKGVGKLFLIVGGDNNDRAMLGFDGLACLVDEELHFIELDE